MTKKVSTKKGTKKDTQKTLKKNVNGKTGKAFTLIELLAVIIILGIIMLIAIPGVTSYISDSRKSTYVATSKRIISGARTLVNQGDLEVFDTDTTYYLPFNMIKTENGTQSPYGEFKKGYVIFTYDGNGYDYYWTCLDSSKTGIEFTDAEKIDNRSIKTGMDDITTDISICGKNIIVVFDEFGNVVEKKNSRTCYNNESGKLDEYKLIKTVEQEVEGQLSEGDEVLIGGTEGFNVVSTNSDKTVLLAKYNLLVGYEVKYVSNFGYKLIREISPNITGYGYQSNLTTTVGYGVVPFSGRKYWQSTSNPNYHDPNYPDARNKSVYTKSMSSVRPNVSEYTNPFNYTQPVVSESDYTIAYYVEPYIRKIENMGVTVYDGGLLSNNQASSLGCSGNSSCSYYRNTWLRNTSFWVASVAWEGSASYQSRIKTISRNGSYSYTDHNSVTSYGVRPIITINTSDIALLNHEYFENKPVIVY